MNKNKIENLYTNRFKNRRKENDKINVKNIQ